MFRVVGCLGGLVLVPFAIVLLIVIVIAANPFAGALGANCALISCRSSGQQATIVDAALALQQRVTGPRANEYTLSDPLMQHVYQYWLDSCGDGAQHICSQAASGTLQCVEFVTAAFFLAGNPLPAFANAADFWPLYQGRPGWLSIPATDYPIQMRGLPNPGDIMVWKGGPYGHVAVVVAVAKPTLTQDGSVTVAQANATGNRWPVDHSGDAGNLYTMPVHPDLSVSTWSGYTVLGYLRPLLGLPVEATPTLVPPDLPVGNPYVPMAWQDAQDAGIDPHLFVRQIYQESGFNPNALSHAGAQGIAQVMPSLARQLNLDPWQPAAALQAAARLMAQYRRHYGGDAEALAAYHVGSETLEQAIDHCGRGWRRCLPDETQLYIQVILNS
jgi:hypothetical protein